MPPRLFVPEPFVQGGTVALPAAAARHVQVLRLQPGDAITLFNGSDGTDWPAEIVRIGRRDVEVRLGVARSVDRELAAEVTIALGVPANDRMDALVEKAGELGAAAIQPLVCERSVVRLSGERADARRAHWQGVAAAASEQCGRARVARVEPVVTLARWLEALGSTAGGASDASSPSPATPASSPSPAAAARARRFVLSLSPGAVAPEHAWVDAAFASDVDGRSRDAARPAIVVLSGPEGGLAPGEEERAVALGFVRVGLGPRVLRADTAPLALLAWLGLHDFAAPARPR